MTSEAESVGPLLGGPMGRGEPATRSRARRFPWIPVVLLLCACRTFGAAGEVSIEVQTLEVKFDHETQGEVQLGLLVYGGGEVVQAQWELALDGRPLGSGVQLLSQRLGPRANTVNLDVPLPLARGARDEGWRTVMLEVSGELTVKRNFSERVAFALRRQALVRGAPRP